MPYKSLKETVDETPSECYGSDEIVCPHCGHKHEESWAWHEEDGSSFDMDCEECLKGFWVDIEYSVSYTTWAHKEN